MSPSLVVIQAGPQDSTAAVQDTVRFPRAPVSPFGAFFRSLVLPGWSQAMLGRRLTAGLFMAWEGVSLGMYLKAARELRYLESVEDPGVEGKRQERQDWLILLAFNHLFAGLEGFVSSHLWDFPDDVRLRALPDGRGVGVTIPFRVP